MSPPRNEEEIMKIWENKIKRGFLALIVLSRFTEREGRRRVRLTGQKIKEYIKQRTKGDWSPSPGSLYPILSLMEEQGLIIHIPSENKKNREYELTDFGEKLYRRLMDQALIFRAPHDQNALSIPEYREALVERYAKKSIREIKKEYQYHQYLSKFLEDYLKERIISDDEL